MSRTHGKADIYIDDTLRWPLGILVEQPTVRKLTVKARRESHPSAWENVLVLTDVVYIGRNGNAQRWTGLGPDGASVELTMVPRRNPGCSSCGNR